MNEEPKKLWGGRFQGQINPLIARFNRSFDFDRAIFTQDATASLAWAQALGRAGVLTNEESAQIERGLKQLIAQAEKDPEFLLKDDRCEDVHSFLETQLGQAIGEAARKLHTGRSRNDQVATAFRLWTRDRVDDIASQLKNTQAALLDLASKAPEAALPGYTHLQRAQPVLLAHWCLAHFEALARDRERFEQVRARVNVMPLGSGALAGTSQKVDRPALAKTLGFTGISKNSLDAVSDRDFLVEFLSAASLVMAHLSRLAEDIILYASQEFGFFELTDAISTGSSLMPQKKNPDPMELVRGKSGRVFGHLMGTLTVLKGLPLAYNKDMQEDKEAAIDTAQTIEICLEATSVVLRELQPQAARMKEAATKGYLNATELADYLVRKGAAFRTAHETAGKIVLEAAQKGVEIDALPLEAIRAHFPGADKDIYEALSLEKTLASKNVPGGTSPERVREALKSAQQSLSGKN